MKRAHIFCCRYRQTLRAFHWREALFEAKRGLFAALSVPAVNVCTVWWEGKKKGGTKNWINLNFSYIVSPTSFVLFIFEVFFFSWIFFPCHHRWIVDFERNLLLRHGMKMAGNDDGGLLTFLKANTPLNNTEGERWQCPKWIQTFFQPCSTSTFFLGGGIFFFLNESTVIATSLRSLDWERLFLKNWSPSAESHMFSLADGRCLLGRGWCWGY